MKKEPIMNVHERDSPNNHNDKRGLFTHGKKDMLRFDLLLCVNMTSLEPISNNWMKKKLYSNSSLDSSSHRDVFRALSTIDDISFS